MAEGRVKIRIEGDSSQFESTLTGIESSVGRLGSVLQGIGQAAGQFIGMQVASGVDILTGSVSKASDLAETVEKVGVLFGQDAMPALVDWARTSSTAFGQSEQQALAAAATFAVFGKSAGLTGQELVDFSKQQVELASDMASFSNTTPEEAIIAIGAAFRGEQEPIRRYGVLLDEMTLRQKAVEMGIISSTKEALTPQQKVLAANAEVIDQTTDAHGNFQRTSDNLANSQRILTAQWEDMQAKIGQKLLPVMTKLTRFAIEKLMPALGRLASAVGSLYNNQIKPFLNFMADHKEILIGIAVAIGVGLVSAVWAAVPAIVAWASAQWAAAAAVIATHLPIVAISVAIGALVAGVIWAYQNWDWFRIAVDAVAHFLTDVLWPAIKDGVSWLAEKLAPAIGWVASMFTDHLWPAIKTIVEWIWDHIVPAVKEHIRILKELWEHAGPIFGKIRDAVGWVIEKVGELVSKFIDLNTQLIEKVGPIKDALIAPFQAAFNAIANIWNSTVGKLSFEIPDWVPNLGGNGFSMPKIPSFSEGGLAFDPMLAIVGDHKTGGAEIITPEKKMAEVVRANSRPSIAIGTINMGNAGVNELTRELSFMLRASR